MRIVKYMQEGGPMPMDTQAGAPAPQGQEMNAQDQLMQMAASIVQELGPEAAAALAEAIMMILEQAQPEMGGAPQEQQFMRCGGKVKKISKKACGGKSAKKSIKKNC